MDTLPAGVSAPAAEARSDAIPPPAAPTTMTSAVAAITAMRGQERGDLTKVLWGARRTERWGAWTVTMHHFIG